MVQEANTGVSKYSKLMGSYAAARELTKSEQDMIRDPYRMRTFEKVEINLPKYALFKPV